MNSISNPVHNFSSIYILCIFECLVHVKVGTDIFTCQLKSLLSTKITILGTILRLKGAILRMAFLDSTGCLVPPAYESWKEHNVPEEKDEKEKLKKRRPVSVSPSSSQEISENQYAVICSEKQAKVISLPSQNCAFKQNITETSFVLRGDIVSLSNGICLACFCANGHIMTFR